MAFGIQLDNVKLIEISKDEKSLIIDRGELDNYRPHDIAKFYLQLGSKFENLENPKVYLVAEGELIKNYPGKSVWFLKNIIMPNLLLPQTDLLILSINNINSGRSRIKASQKLIVYSDQEYNSVDQYLEQNKKGIPEKFIKEEEGYQDTEELFQDTALEDKTIKTNTYEQLSKVPYKEKSDEYKDNISDLYFVGNTRVSLVDILKKEDKLLLDSMSRLYLNNSKKLKYGLTNGMYREQSLSAEKNFEERRYSVNSVYSEKKDATKNHEQINPKFADKLKRDGIHWSDDMDDKTLRQYFITSGIVNERERRERVLNEREGHEVMVHYDGSLTDHTTALDQNARSMGYSLGLSYDIHLARSSPTLKNWSLQLSLEWGASHYDLGVLNGTSQEVLYGGMLNYYLLNNPLSLNTFIYELGVGLKAGQSHMSGSGLSKVYTYQMVSVPTLQLLTKYRFHIGDLTEDSVNIGSALHAGIIFERKKLSINDIATENINGILYANDVKFQIGMGFYF